MKDLRKIQRCLDRMKKAADEIKAEIPTFQWSYDLQVSVEYKGDDGKNSD